MKSPITSISLLIAAALSGNIKEANCQQIYDPVEIKKFVEESTLTCSSAIRLQNMGSKYFLFSQEVQYGAGSGQ